MRKARGGGDPMGKWGGHRVRQNKSWVKKQLTQQGEGRGVGLNVDLLVRKIRGCQTIIGRGARHGKQSRKGNSKEGHPCGILGPGTVGEKVLGNGEGGFFLGD